MTTLIAAAITFSPLHTREQPTRSLELLEGASGSFPPSMANTVEEMSFQHSKTMFG